MRLRRASGVPAPPDAAAPSPRSTSSAAAASPPAAAASAPTAASQGAAVHQPWGDTLSRRRVVFVLASVMLGMLLSALDQTVVGTAMPKIIGALNGMQHYAWVATGYLLASAASMPIWGKLSDAYGRRNFFIVGMIIFVAGSALCGQAHTMTELIAFRAFQGLGAGAMMPIVQAIIGDIFPPAQRAKWAGILMSVFGFATIVGPLLGGWITDTVGWRWTFYVNLPVGVIALVFAVVALPGHVSLRRHRIDYAGSALLVTAAVPLLLGFSWVSNPGYTWSSPTIIGLFAFSVVMWVVFFLWEMRAAEPVINPRLFTNSIFSVSAAASSLQSAAMFGAIMFLPLFVQGVLGKTATNSGIILMPLMIGAIITSIGAGQILSRTGRYKILVILGFAAAAAGSYLLSRMRVDTTQFTLARDMVVMGLGLGIAMSAFTVIVQNQYPSHRLGEVTAGLQFFRAIGSTIGLAIFGTILNNRFAAEMRLTLPAQLKGAATKLDNPQVLVSPTARDQLAKSFAKFGAQGQQLFGAFMNAVRHSLDSAISSLFVLATVIGLLGLLTVLLLKEVPLRRTHSLVETAEEAAAGEAGVVPVVDLGEDEVAGAFGGGGAPDTFGAAEADPLQ
jgi:EmrB/QacA subfamily drug resistance transporter